MLGAKPLPLENIRHPIILNKGDDFMDKEFVGIGEAANYLGVSTEALRDWDRRKKLIPQRRLKGGKRLYSIEQLNNYRNNKG